MEALIAIFAELLFALLYPALSVVFALVAAIFEAIVALVAGIFGLSFSRKPKAEPKAPAPAPAPAPKPRRKSRFLHWVAGIAVVVAGVFAVANYAFFPNLVGAIVSRVEAKSGAQIDYAGVQGDFFRGRIGFDGLRVLRAADEKAGVDVQIARAEADINVFTLLSSEIVVEELSASGITGAVGLVQKDKAPKEERPRKRSFVVERLSLSEADLQIGLADGSQHPLQIVRAEAEPLRSRLAVFDLFFRSNLEATFGGAEFTVRTAKISDAGRETQWAIDDLDLTVVAALAPRAPLSWMTSGTLSAQVQDRWDRSKGRGLADAEIEMDWQVTIAKPQMDPQLAPRGPERVLATPIAAVVNRRTRPLDLAFRVTLSEGELMQGTSGDLKALGRAVADGILENLGAPEDPEKPGILRNLLKRKPSKE